MAKKTEITVEEIKKSLLPSIAELFKVQAEVFDRKLDKLDQKVDKLDQKFEAKFEEAKNETRGLRVLIEQLDRKFSQDLIQTQDIEYDASRAST